MFCPKCGVENIDTARFCRKCGKQLPDRARIRQAATTRGSLIGHTLDGKYRIDAKLGSGGMGDCYRATRLLIGDSVAVKVLHPHLAADPQAAERFRREAVTATKLRHRNVVTIYDVGISSVLNVPYILMEIAEGFTLRQMLEQYSVLPLDFVVTVTTQVCSALDEAHNLGIIHRDIKPENIVANQTTTGWHIKMLDFGIAKLYHQADIGLTQDGTAMGTPQYMSPEQCLGERLDARSDVYSVGIMLYEMLTGTVPFKSATPAAIAVFQVQSEPAALRDRGADIDAEVERVVLRALAKAPDDRQQTAAELSRELIQAATAAFRAGKAAISEAPVAAPAAEPAFTADSEPELTTVDPDHQESVAGAKTDAANDEPEQSLVLPAAQALEPSDGEPKLSADTDSDIKLVFEEVEYRLDEMFPTVSSAVSLESLTPVAVAPAMDPTPAPAPPPISSQAPAAESSIPTEAFSVVDVERKEVEGSVDSAVEFTFAEKYASAPPTLRRLGRWIAPLLLLAFATIAGAWYFGYLRDSKTHDRSEASTRSAPVVPPLPAGMVLVPGGEFLMGIADGDERSRPASVTVKPFYMDTTEVTNEAYKEFVDATNHPLPPSWKNGTFPHGKSKFPVTGVDWDDANEYAEWAGKRLPTEEEWEFAARGTDGRLYPWGNDWKSGYANADKQAKGTREVGQGDGKSPFGAFDMVGNAWEWTASDFVPYPGGKPSGSTSSKLKVIRGGCFLSKPNQATTVFRVGWIARGGNEYDNTGFRCAKDFLANSQ